MLVRVLTVSVYDDEIATLAADDGDLPIRRLTSSAARFEIFPCVPARRRSPFDAATLCYGCDQLTAGRVPAQGRRNRAQLSRRWYLCGNIHRTGATGRFSNMDPDHLQCSRRTFVIRVAGPDGVGRRCLRRSWAGCIQGIAVQRG